ncbi:uncharacterized protein LOC110852343 [Folsomia candida]|uniref:uncharacterized protein LOC110852343 n=1 Tax=Folsomia candida TaxID=158441 RepID=UPI000B8F1DF4|nr:uncharacterized protein LOC110852343 [Folsomia candida]
MSKKVLIVLPSKDFDVTETSVPWRKLTDAKVQVDFCTENGIPGECDPLLLDGVIFGKLGAAPEAKAFYHEMIKTKEFQNPTKYKDTEFMDYDCVLFPGGHAPGMKQYLENETIRDKIVPYFKNKSKVVAAVCHGTIVLSRTIDNATGKSILYNRKSTCLPKYMERNAYYLTAWKLGKYYRTYDDYVEDEVRQAMQFPDKQFQPGTCNQFGSLDERYAFVCVDENYISARWPGDCYKLADTILEMINPVNH